MRFIPGTWFGEAGCKSLSVVVFSGAKSVTQSLHLLNCQWYTDQLSWCPVVQVQQGCYGTTAESNCRLRRHEYMTWFWLFCLTYTMEIAINLLCMYVYVCMWACAEVRILLPRELQACQQVLYSLSHSLALSNPFSITCVPSPPTLGTVSSLDKRNMDSLHKKQPQSLQSFLSL